MQSKNLHVATDKASVCGLPLMNNIITMPGANVAVVSIPQVVGMTRAR